MKTLELNRLTWTALSLALILGACVPKSDHPASSTISGGSASGGVAGGKPGGSLMDGTQDTGGGTGFDRSVFEHYINDPVTLPGYKIVEGLLNNIVPSGNYKNLHRQVFDYRFTKMKTWFVGPFDLKKIDKDVLGVTYIRNSTVQIALQTKPSIWIDSRIFNDSETTDDERADTILHEMVMNFYLLQFESPADICKSYSAGETWVVDRCPAPSEVPLHVLTKDDTAHIWAVVGWIKNAAKQPVDELEFVRELGRENFGNQAAHYAWGYSDHPPLTVNEADVVRAIKAADLVGKPLAFCKMVNADKTVDCKVELLEQPPRLRITSGKESIETEVFQKLRNPLQALEDWDESSLYEVSTYDEANYHMLKAGDKFIRAFMEFKAENDYVSNLVIDSIVLKPLVVTGINKDGDPIFQVINTSNVSGDTIIVTKKRNEMNSEAATLKDLKAF
jgi:hypothetical protein